MMGNEYGTDSNHLSLEGKAQGEKVSMLGSSTSGVGGEMAAPDDLYHDGEYATTASAVSMCQQLSSPQFSQRPPPQYMQSLPGLQHLQRAFPQPNAPAALPLPLALASIISPYR